MNLEVDESFRRVGLTQRDLDTIAALGDDAQLSAFRELAPLGVFPARELTRHPEWLAPICDGADSPRDVEGVVAELDRDLADGAPLEKVLRRFKRRESLRIFLREVRGASTRETTAEFAALAEGCLRVAVRELSTGRFDGLQEKFTVIGMGKLGGCELNPSSDVDLVFACDNAAMEDGVLRERLAEYSRALVDVTAALTSDGYVFRVDLRLRPDGTQGPIVLPVRATVDYYLQLGRTWERSAWMKARPVAGNLELGERVISGLEPFVYRKYLDYSALEELRAMKAKIEANATIEAVHGRKDEPQEAAPDPVQAPLADRLKRRLRGGSSRRRKIVVTQPEPDTDEAGVLGWDTKVGVGGIREIEFFVQALQLVHSGAQPGLRVRNTMEALDALLWAGLITDDVHSDLTDSYDFLRRLEHRIQMGEDRQSHSLPNSWSGFDQLAARFDYSRAELTEQVLGARQRVRAIFERLFAEEPRDRAVPTLPGDRDDSLELVVRAESSQLGGTGVRSALASLGFGRPRQVAGQLEVLRSKAWGPFRELSYGADLQLASQLIADAAAAPDPDQAFSLLSRFAQAVGDRPGYWGMLRDNPHATRLLLQVFGSSSYLGGALISDPNVFERLLTVGAVAVQKPARRIEAELDERLEGLEDPEHRLGVIRRFHREETLRIGLHETGGAARIEQTMEQLSLLAETVVERVLLEVYEPLRTRRRRPGSVLPQIDELSFAIVAMGKLGGRELGFGSDLDVVFVYEEDRQWRLEHTFFARVAQRLIRSLSMASVEGKMYEVDTRLRPSGNRGALVVSADAFEEYYGGEAGLWEKQALLRARPIYGRTSLVERIENVRAEVSLRPSYGTRDLEQISSMREKMNDALYQHGTRDVKYGSGGIIDVEFAAQAMQLAAEIEPGEPRASQSVREVLVEIESKEAAQDYLWLCRLLARLRMSSEAATSVLPSTDAELRMIARRMGHHGDGAAEAFLEQYDTTTRRCRERYERALAPG